MAIIRHISCDNQIGIARLRRGDLHGVFKIAHAHRQRMSHAFGATAGDGSETE